MNIRVTVAVVVVAAGVACGGGPSKADFAKKANPPCQTANTELAGVTRPADFRQLGEVAGKVAASTDKQVKALAQLDQPSDDKAQLQRSLADMRATVTSGRAVESAVQKGDLRAAEAGVRDMRQASEKADDGARTYGLTECGKGSRGAAVLVSDASNDVLKRELIARADRICADLNRKIEAMPEPDSDEELINATIPLAEKLIADLRAIPVPDAQRQAYDDVMAANDRLLGLFRDASTAAKTRNTKRLEQLYDQIDTASIDADKKADAFGFKDCGSDA